MFKHFRQEDPALVAAIAELFATLANLDPIDDKDQYNATLKQIKELYDLKRKPLDIDPNKIAAVAGNILVAVIVIKFEQTAVITTKLGTFLAKL